MAVWDIFDSNAYSMQEMTEGINQLPYKPRFLGQLSSQFGLFRETGIPTTTFLLESRDSKISLIPDTPRNAPAAKLPAEKRKARAFSTLHLPLVDEVWPDDVQNVRQFNTENQLATVESVVGEKMESMRDSFEVNHEYHRLNAIQGRVKDHDGTTLLSMYTAFSLTEKVVDFNLDTSPTSETLQADCSEVIREIEDVLGNQVYTGIIGLCSDTFWDSLVSIDPVLAAFDRWQNGSFLRDDLRFFGFQYKGITWYNYRGKVGSQDFITAGDARFFPVGVPGLFRGHYAPANWIDAANTVGLPMYLAQEPKPKKMGRDIFGETNPFFYCTQPGVCVRGTRT